MDNLDLMYHLCFRPRAIRGRRPRPNGGHRRPRPICGVYAARYTSTCPTSEPIGRPSNFLEQQSFPDPVNTGDVFWDELNVKIKSLFEDVAIQRKRIHAKTSVRPKLKGTSSEVASMWRACDATLSMAREISHSLHQEDLIPYPEPVWFSFREFGTHTSHDITWWNEVVLELLAAKANDCRALATSASTGGALVAMAKEGNKLASEEEGGVLAERAAEEGGTTRASLGGDLAAEEGGEVAAEKGGGLSANLQKKNRNYLAAEEGERSNFINWKYYYQKIHNQNADTEEENKENQISDDEGELKAKWAQGA